jgi:hypothetical protein
MQQQLVANLPMTTSLEVTFAAYLAILLGTVENQFVRLAFGVFLLVLVFACRPGFRTSLSVSPSHSLPLSLSLSVYLAGTLLPVLFLVVLYLNSEARKVGDFTEEGYNFDE